VILVEGPDGAGKTTLVRDLQHQYGFVEGERGTTDRKLLYTVTRQDTYTALAEAVRGDAPAKIWDRLFFSEQVYAPIVGRDCEFNDYESHYVRAVMAALGCPVIVCLPPLATVQANIAKADQMRGVNENIADIYNRYDDDRFMLWPKCTVFYDYTMVRTIDDRRKPYVGLNQIWDLIEDYLSYREERQWSLTGQPS